MVREILSPEVLRFSAGNSIQTVRCNPQNIIALVQALPRKRSLQLVEHEINGLPQTVTAILSRPFRLP
jgi:hypothetical protein